MRSFTPLRPFYVLRAGMDQTANATNSTNLLGRILSRIVSIGGSTGLLRRV